MTSDTRAPATLYGATCRTCGHATTFTAPECALTAPSVYRLLYLSGAVELAPGRWTCWRCSLAAPAQRHSADYVQEQAKAIDHNLTSADIAAIDYARGDRRGAWR